MSTGLIVVLAAFVLAGVGALVLLGNSLFGNRSVNSSLRNLVASQRALAEGGPGGKAKPSIFKAIQGVALPARKSDSRLTLRKRLKYAQWPIPPIAFRVCELGISLLAFSFISMKMNMVMSSMSLLAGPIFMRWLLNTTMERRFKRFDSDYPQFLLSLVGLLKTGMTAMGALESAAQGLEDTSLVREECEMMVERLRFGVSEDKSIGAFGEDIYHPEIELFVQALLLSRRVGGTLSDTLERLAKQVRKRQYFRNSAKAAVGMQRGSIWIIIGLLVFIEGYLYWMFPSMVMEAIQSDMGWQVWQFGIVVILLGIFWVRQVTKIRI